MANTSTSYDYRITTAAQTTMFGKRTGGSKARLESDACSEVAAGAGPSISAAKQALLNQLGRLASQTDRAYLFCGDGTVLAVYFSADSWGYDICGPTRQRSACILPGATFEQAKQAAVDHAGQSYGGVHHVC